MKLSIVIRAFADHDRQRSEEHTSELQSLAVISYAVFCLNKKNVHQLAHMTCTIPDLVQALLMIRREVIRSTLQEDLRKPINLFLFHPTTTPESYTTANPLSLPDALPI